MKPLIEIQTVPISIEFKTTSASFQPTESTAQLEMTTDKGGLQIKSSPIKLNVDTYEARKSVNPTLKANMEKFASDGKQAAYEATAQYAQEGKILLNIHLNQDAFQQIADLRLGNNEHKTPNIKWIPEHPADISWEPGDMTIKYETDKLNFDFKQNKQPLEFVPGDIEFVINQRPKVIVTYVGDPLYVPPSAAPDYIDTEA
ncbi:DUF6470 family protein [Clostridium aminobutyricum]|uniref:Uncharacterized protein n=1 Tax=Clostridium aminobutyricum TaxID=33953 RepID=A0A939IJ47_CLOAM|nr:DUF6470 family protein [Clostridium aminobutyricum]MBN7773741.1 hypothetical protein [Clostridium aminobutyricum]